MKNIYLRKKIEEIMIALVKSCIILCILLPLSATVVKNHINDSSPETYDTYECCNIENIENHINIQKNILQNIQKPLPDSIPLVFQKRRLFSSYVSSSLSVCRQIR